MILYYTFKQKTKVFASALGDFLQQPVYSLECELNGKSDLKFMFGALKSCVTKARYPVSNMPESVPSEIYVCSPVWGGHLASPVRYFLENMDLRGTTVNVLLTASVPVEKYRKNAMEFLNKIPCTQGRVFIFATNDKVLPEKDVIIDQFQEMLANE